MKIDARTMAAIALVLLGLALLDQGTTLRILGTIQSLVIIVLGITATLYLWKRM